MRIRVQFNEGVESVVLLDVAEMPRIGEGLVMPIELDPNGVDVFRVIDVAQYPVRAGDIAPNMMQRADVRVAGSLATGPRRTADSELCGIEWDDRDNPNIPRGFGYSCELPWEHEGKHRSGTFEWVK